jgi:MFS transporter, DHA3 family, macrolide efflux protein
VESTYQPPEHGFRTFLIVWVTQSISSMGSVITYFALTLWMTLVLYPLPSQKSELAFALTAVALVSTVAIMVVAPFAGAWADRHDRKRVMLWTNILNGCVSLILITLLLTHHLHIWSLLILAAADSILGTFHNSAFDASYVMLVPEKQLSRANGLMQTMWSLAGILPPAIAASLITLPTLARQGLVPEPLKSMLSHLADGTPIAVMIDAISFFIAGITLLFLFIPSPQRPELASVKKRDRKVGYTPKQSSIWQDIREGALFIWHRPPLLWLLATFTVGNLAGSVVQVLPPLLLKFDLQTNLQSHGLNLQTGLAIFSTVSSVGGLVGGLIISAWGGLRKKRVYGVVGALLTAGIAQAVLGLSPFFYLTVAMAFIGSAMIPVMNTHSQTIWQTQTPRELQGRVFSVRRVIAQFTFPIGTAISGWTGGLFSPGLVIAVFGGLLAVFTLGQFFNPQLLRAEDKDGLDAMAAKRRGVVSADAPLSE